MLSYISNVKLIPKMSIEIYKKNLSIIKRKDGISMCAPLDKLYGKSAEEVLREVGIEDDIPICLESILKYYGISSLPQDFSKIEQLEAIKDTVDKKGHILGIIVCDGDNAGIFYKHDDKPNRQRFTIAHELGHCAAINEPFKSFVEFRNDLISDDEKEFSANTFAGELLIPKNSLLRIHKMMTVPDLETLSKVFSVSTNVMRERLKALRLPYAG